MRCISGPLALFQRVGSAAQLSRAAAPWSKPPSCLGNTPHGLLESAALIELACAQRGQPLQGPNRRPCALAVLKQRLAPRGHASSTTPCNVLPDDVAPGPMRTDARQRQISDARPSGPSLGAAATLSRSAKVAWQRRAMTWPTFRNAVLGESMYDNRGPRTHALASWRLGPAPCSTGPICLPKGGGVSANVFARGALQTLGLQLRASNPLLSSAWRPPNTL